MEALRRHFVDIKIVSPDDRVFKDECICSFDTAESERGLYICMKTFEAVGERFLQYYFNRYGHHVYLHHKRIKYRVNKPEGTDTKPKRLAIGVEGGFDPDAASKDYRTEDSYSIFVMGEQAPIPFPDPDLPELVLQSANSIIAANSQDTQEPNIGFWDGEQRQVSRHAQDLEQLEPAPKVPASGWKCEKCDLTENLWLNLTDGSILCGRKFFDGSGGNNHAVDHYNECHYPLAVKLGTITASGADVYSYPEEDMVLDPHLDRHLAHFGIDIQTMTKTERSMLELEIDINEKLGEWSVIQEEGRELEPVSGPGFTGLANLGNSCYMNSVLQILFSIKEFQERYGPPERVFNAGDGVRDFNHQMAKLADGLLSGKYSTIDPQTKQQKGIQPKSFKYYVCATDQNFSSKRQQDAHEFFLFLMDLIERSDRTGRFIEESQTGEKNTFDPTKCLEFVIEDRIECSQSKKVKYTHRVEFCLPLHVEVDMAVNKDEVEEFKRELEEASDPTNLTPVRPRIPLRSCIEQFSKPETLTEFYSSAIGSNTTAEKSSKISRFPKFFMFQMKKFQCGSDWVPRKLDVAFDVPEILDLEFLEGQGLRPDEIELDDEGSLEATSSGEHSQGSASNIEPNSEAVATLLAMGIDISAAITALRVCNNDAQRAIEYIFDPESFNRQQASAPASDVHSDHSRLTIATRPDPLKMKLFTPDTKPKLYQLKAFISHMGTSTVCGHYVCHIRKDERWYIFNDNKVALSKKPPMELGYLYFYERVQS